MRRIFVKIKKDTLPQVKDRYPFIYLEMGRLEVDDSSVKWIDSEGDVVKIPVATIGSILLGVGTTVTHAAVKACTQANTTLCWVGEDSLLYYCGGISPTANTKNIKKQMALYANPSHKLSVAKNMFSHRFQGGDFNNKTLKEMMGMEGYRVKKLYESKAQEYQVGWKGRSYTPDKFQLSDTTNKILTAANSALYGLICSSVHSMGYSPYIGFIHSGSPLPFIYDLADLYKDELTIDLSFMLTKVMAGDYDRKKVSDEFRKRVIEYKLLERIGDDIEGIFKV